MRIGKARLNRVCQVPLNGVLSTLSGMEIGEKIRLARHTKGLSLEALGKLVGVSRSAVHQWENGLVTNITVTNRIRLSEALEMPIAELLPPEATAGEVTIRDKRHLLLHELFDSASEPLQEAYLRLLLVMRGDPESSALES
jgi:transcriptional regulator with XRE-family HTH domain